MDLILEQIRKGNKKVYKNFFIKNYYGLVTYAYGYLFDKWASEEIVQECFIDLWQKRKHIQVNISLAAYVRKMVKNRCLNYLKTVKITDHCKVLETNLRLSYDITESGFNKEQQRDKQYHQILKIIDTLPNKMCQIVRLRYLHNYTYKEIAQELNISVNTVKTQLKRAKIRMMKLLTGILVLLELFQS